VLRAAYAFLNLVRPEEDNDVRIGIQPEQRVRELRMHHDARFDLLPVKVVGLRDGDVVADNADRIEGNRGWAGHVFSGAVEKTAEAGKHELKLSDDAKAVTWGA
jgi:hypothetical protein